MIDAQEWRVPRGSAFRVEIPKMGGQTETRLAVLCGKHAAFPFFRLWLDGQGRWTGPRHTIDGRILGVWEGDLPPNLPRDRRVLYDLGMGLNPARPGTIHSLIEDAVARKEDDTMTMTAESTAPTETPIAKLRSGRKSNQERGMIAAIAAVRVALAKGDTDIQAAAEAAQAFTDIAPKGDLSALDGIVEHVKASMAEAAKATAAKPSQAALPGTTAPPSPAPTPATAVSSAVKTVTGWVAYVISGPGGETHVPKLFITNVPTSGTEDEAIVALRLRAILEAHFDFSVAGVPWANHKVGISVRTAPVEVQRAWRLDNVRRIDHRDLITDELPE